VALSRSTSTGSGNNTLSLSVHDVLDISDESNQLTVAGNAGDSVHIGAAGRLAARPASAARTTQSTLPVQATLLVAQDITHGRCVMTQPEAATTAAVAAATPKLEITCSRQLPEWLARA
jgi:hypothetical protein